MTKKEKDKFLMYKGHPLVRFGNIIFYGSVTDKYIIMMQIIEESDYAGVNVKDLKKSSKILIQLQLNGDVKDRIEKETEKDDMAQAMEIASIWLDRALKEI